MMSRIKEYFTKSERIKPINDYFNAVDELFKKQFKVIKLMDGRIRTLEDQHEIMHHFLVEINKYLVVIADKRTENDLSKNEQQKENS